ncbi:hypothetical protein MVEN_00974300 [Mycena venus]|uniref:Uncharacterized protein n=1 Tax=Mycena venus TaxID=2733690 RepID=A0A8H6Y8Q8_9AGAR|nr:hypothetical protein MVEN_00974300 [Mycena venus]
MKTRPVSILSTVVFAVSFASGVQSISEEIETIQPEPCTVRAWVRAEDLSPDHISRGELRIKVPRAECANQIASVALRLQLDEFGEFKYLKRGAVVPEVQLSNQSAPLGYADWMGGDGVYDYQAHDDGLSDPELWTVKAEERRAWTTEVILLENNPDLSQPIVAAFTVAVPRVNYPPVAEKYHYLEGGPVSQHSSSDLGYRYFAVVTFTDGHTQDVAAGYTAFIPSSSQMNVPAPFTWSSTFEDSECRDNGSPAWNKRAEDLEKCLPEADRSSFAAEITLEEGNVLQRGRLLKGRVTVHSTKNGSTTMSDITLNIMTLSRDHWAQAQAAAGGDVEFYNATSWPCNPSYGRRELYAESENYAYLFYENDEEWMVRNGRFSSTENKPISPANPYYDFEIEVPPETPVDFTSYYTTGESFLQFGLTVLYSIDVAKCMQPNRFKSNVPGDEEMTTDEAAGTEEGLWDMYTRVGKPAISNSRWYRSMTLQAMVPVTVVGNAMIQHPVPHYLMSGAAAPVLRSGLQLEMPASFPLAQPVFTVEGVANTSARLMQSGTTDPYKQHQQFMIMTRLRRDYPDPTRNYQKGDYAGVLWKKKVVAEERGILPLRTEGLNGGESQRPFHVTP